MPKPEKIRIPILNDKFVAAILKVKPTANMPRSDSKRKNAPKRKVKRSK